MTQTIAPEQTVSNAAHQYEAPRPGRSYCVAVESYDCLAPAGYATGMGACAVSGVKRADLHTCDYCGESVCHNCSTAIDGRRVCDNHSEHELRFWAGVPAIDQSN